MLAAWTLAAIHGVDTFSAAAIRAFARSSIIMAAIQDLAGKYRDRLICPDISSTGHPDSSHGVGLKLTCHCFFIFITAHGACCKITGSSLSRCRGFTSKLTASFTQCQAGASLCCLCWPFTRQGQGLADSGPQPQPYRLWVGGSRYGMSPKHLGRMKLDGAQSIHDREPSRREAG